MTELDASLHLLPSLLLYLLLGLGLGTLFFLGLWRTLARPLSAWLIALSSLGRFAGVGLVLALVSQQGALPLLATGLGIVCARAVVMRRLRGPGL